MKIIRILAAVGSSKSRNQRKPMQKYKKYKKIIKNIKKYKKAETSSKKYKIISLGACLQNFKDFKKFWVEIKKCYNYRDFILWFILCVTGAIDSTTDAGCWIQNSQEFQEIRSLVFSL